MVKIPRVEEQCDKCGGSGKLTLFDEVKLIIAGCKVGGLEGNNMSLEPFKSGADAKYKAEIFAKFCYNYVSSVFMDAFEQKYRELICDMRKKYGTDL